MPSCVLCINGPLVVRLFHFGFYGMIFLHKPWPFNNMNCPFKNEKLVPPCRRELSWFSLPWRSCFLSRRGCCIGLTHWSHPAEGSALCKACKGPQPAAGLSGFVETSWLQDCHMPGWGQDLCSERGSGSTYSTPAPHPPPTEGLQTANSTGSPASFVSFLGF